MPEALARMNSVLGLSAGAGLSPRRARYFSLLRQRKVPKRKATPSLRPLRGAKGQTCGGAVAGCAVELALRCARRSDSHGESVHEAWALRRPCSPRNRPAAGAASRGGEPNIQTAGHPFGPSLRSAWPAQRVALAPARWGRAQRSEAKARVDVWFPLPLWMRRGAQRAGWRVCRRTHALRGLTRCGCLSGARQRAAHTAREHRRLPRSEAQGTQTAGSPFFWVLFFGEAKKSASHAGRLPASALNKGMRPNQRPKENTTRTIATSAYPTSAPSQKHPKTTRRAHP
ncbi:hypothetical protein QF021_000596 [Acidovorax delafieldii]|nr:hypothetical protein [Acidovorax delafieldii]